MTSTPTIAHLIQNVNIPFKLCSKVFNAIYFYLSAFTFSQVAFLLSLKEQIFLVTFLNFNQAFKNSILYFEGFFNETSY